MNTGHEKLRMQDALRVKSAELWLLLGQPQQALDELMQLSDDAKRHPWTLKVLKRAFQAAQAFA